MLKVFYFLPWFHAGTGQETMLSTVIKFGFGKWDSTIVSNSFVTFKGLFPDHCPVKLMQFKNYYSLIFKFRNREQIFKHADIIHIKSGIPYLYYTTKLTKPTIYTLYGPWETRSESFANKIRGFAVNTLERKKILEKADVLIGVSKWVCEFYSKNMGLDPIYIPDSFDLSLFKFKEKVPDPHKLKLIIVGGWDGFNGRKRQHEVINTMPMLLKEYSGLRLRLVGLEEEQMDTLKDIAINIGVVKSIDFTGKVSAEDLASIIADSDILLSPSTWEGFHRPTIEAMASGTPVLARDTTSIVNPNIAAHYWHVRESKGGETFDVSYSDLAEKIGHIIDNYSYYAVNGLKYALQFDNNAVLPKYENLYRELASNGGKHK